SFAASGASASLMGEYWDVAPNTIATIDQAINAVSGGADPTTATFTSSDIKYGDPNTNWVIGDLANFLQADAGSIVGSNTNFQESVVRLTGKVVLNDGDQIDVTSDDGFRLIIGGTTVSEFLGLRPPNNTTSAVWNGGSGMFHATLWYFEGQRTQAQLISNLGGFAAPIPVPASALMLISALGGVVVMRRRKKA
ncbi:MAG: VPLPA-CTERM sorting domain-containing protein, partial [Tateyamaria sp.]